MIKTFSAYWQFLKKPQLLKVSNHKKVIQSDFLWLLLLNLSFALVLTLVSLLLTHFKLINEYDSIDLIKEFGVFGSILFMCVFAPFLEEYTFRWHLRKRYASIYFILFAISGIIISHLQNGYIGFSVFLLFLFIAIYLHHRLKKLSQIRKQKLWQAFFPFVFYLSAVIFGLIHLSNYKGLTLKDPTFIFYISSQTLGGLSLGYIRIKHGLKYSILYHAVFNSIVFLLWLLFGQ